MGFTLVSNSFIKTYFHIYLIHSSVWPENVGPKKDIYSLGYNPQFSLRVNVPDKKSAAVWLLLSKHIMVTEENTDYITLHVYDDTNGERIYYPGTPFKEVRPLL
jgi:calpain-7